MADVARLAEVHESTVSLALRNHPSIPEATRDRVRRAAERIGYQTNPLVAALMSFRSSAKETPRHTTLAFVTSSRPTQAWRESRTLCDQFAGAQERAKLLGYHIEEFAFHAPGLTPARFSQMLRNRGIIGLIIAPLRNGNDTLAIQWEHFAAVAMAFTLQRPDIPRVGSDHGQSIRLAITRCRERGYRRIGLAVQRTIMERVEMQWLAGYLVEHTAAPAPSIVAPLIAETWSEDTFWKWLKAERPEVVLTGGDYASVMSWLKRGGRAARDVGVVSLDLHLRDGSVAGIDQHSHELGATVVDHLIARLHRNERGTPPRAVRSHVMGEWVEGATIRAPLTPAV
jgi:LacI family transcriptional regulator